jgi:hypothetical protein
VKIRNAIFFYAGVTYLSLELAFVYFINGLQKKDTVLGMNKVRWILDVIRNLGDKRVREDGIFYDDMAGRRNFSTKVLP